MSTQTDPFSQVRIGAKKSDSFTPEKQNVSENDAFSQVRIKQSQDFPGIYETGRHAARIGSRIAETIGGIPGDVSSLIQSGVFSGLEKLVGQKASPEAFEEAKKFRAPTSKELKKLSEESTGGFTSAKNKTEKTIDEYVETVSSLLGPMKFRKALGVALGGLGAKKGIEFIGLGEAPQEAGKLGTMFLATLYNPGGAMKYASSQFNKADALSKGASISAAPFESTIANMVDDLRKGVSTSSKNAVIKPAEELLSKVKNGKIAVHDLTAAKRDINDLMGEPETLEGAKKLLRKLGKEVDKALRPYEKVNPAFKEAYRPANEIYGAVKQGNKASNFISKILGPKSVLAAVVGESVLGHPEAIVPTLGIAGAAIGTAKTADFFTRLSKSKALRDFYSKALIAAANEDAAALRLYEGKIREALEE